ncbi:MAG TPA: DUF2207 domain-containing protein, partial [Anaerolineae bacterium]|nr:DUF2207 domain-containing protein [Anaerolineae bacterium]
MKNKTFKLQYILLPLLLLVLFTLRPGISRAQSKSFVWDTYDVVITLLPNGEMRVEETQTLNFSGAPFSYGFATIPTGSAGNNDGIKDLTVREGDLTYVESSSNAPGTYELSREGDEIRIDWYFEPALGQRTYTFSYTVEGGVIVEDEGDQIFWKAIPADHPAYVNNSAVTIRLPEGVTPQQYTGTTDYLVAGYAGGDSSLVQTFVSDDGRTITYQLLQPLPPGAPFEVRVQFPHGLLDIPVPRWQTLQQRQDVFNLMGLVLGIFLAIAGPLVVLALWYSKGRDPQTGVVVPDYISEPPSDLLPGIVGTLVDEKADMRDVVSTIIDLARRGYLTIQEEGKDHIFVRTDKRETEELRPFEIKLLQSLFGSKQERSLKSLRYKFHNKLPAIRKLMYQELEEDGLVNKSPETVRQGYTALGAGVIILAGIAFFGGILILPGEMILLAFCPAIAMAVSGAALLIAARHMPRKTEKGTIAAEQWLAFKSYLQRIEAYENLTDVGEIFEKYLPYATAF